MDPGEKPSLERLLTLKEMVMGPTLYTFYKLQLMFGLSYVGKPKFCQSAINDFYKESNISLAGFEGVL